MKLRRIAGAVLMQITLVLALTAAAHAQLPSLALKDSKINHDVSLALKSLYAHNEAAEALGAKAKAILVFPDIKKAAFLVGAQFRYGGLRRGRKTICYYRTGAVLMDSKPG